MLKEKSFNTGVVEINYAEGPPSGPPLVLFHGFPGRWEDFLPIIPALSMRWHIYALDYRGCGRSGRVPGHYRPEDYADDFITFLQNQLNEPGILFGHSAGGMLSILLAAQLPEKVRALIIGDSPIDVEQLLVYMSSEEFKSYYSTLRDLAGHSVKELISALADIPVRVLGQDTPVRYGDRPDVDAASLLSWAKEVSQLDPETLEFHARGRAKEYFEKVDFERALSKISCPVLLLQGNPSLDGFMSDKEVEYALSVLPDATHVLIENAGHDLGLNTWEVAPLLRAVTNFLESL